MEEVENGGGDEADTPGQNCCCWDPTATDHHTIQRVHVRLVGFLLVLLLLLRLVILFLSHRMERRLWSAAISSVGWFNPRGE